MLFGNKKAIINLSAMKRNLESHAYLLVICYFERSQCLFCSFGHNKRFAQTNDQKIGMRFLSVSLSLLVGQIKENRKMKCNLLLFSFIYQANEKTAIKTQAPIIYSSSRVTNRYTKIRSQTRYAE